MVHQQEIKFATSGHGHVQDLSGRIERIVKESGIQTGIVSIFNVGSTAAVGTIEYEPGLCHDLPKMLSEVFPPGRHYQHEQAWHDGNTHSHLQATTLGASFTAPVRQGRLVMGTFQQIFHMECDIKPRDRTVVVTVLGE